MMFTKFPSLPQEIQDEIWTATLPRPRIFNVDILSDEEAHTHRYFWGLRNVNPFPIALQICYDSRAAALRQGFFFEYSPNKSLYFIPETDILYFRRNRVYFLNAKEPISMPGLDRVFNFGFESFLLPSGLSEEEYWRTCVKRLYIHTPHLKTLNRISPLSQNREFCEYALSSLSEDVKVNWYGTERDAVYKPWTDREVSIVKALERCEHRPEICGWKLTSELIVPEGLSLLFDAS